MRITQYGVWPDPTLTPQEAAGVGLYREVKSDGKVIPGIARKVYPFTLIQTSVVGEQSRLSVTYVTSGLRTLLMGMTFSGDVEFWSLSCLTASGETLFATGPVSALINTPARDGTAAPSPGGAITMGGVVPEGLLRPPGRPLTWDPPWLIDGTQALVFNGAPLTAAYVAAPGQRGVLNFAMHVWELPGATGSRGPIPPDRRAPPGFPVPPLRQVKATR